MSESKNKLWELEGLRGLASVIVLFNHVQLMVQPEFIAFKRFIYTDISRRVYAVVDSLTSGMSQGAFGVAIFWILSGFVLTIRYHEYARQDVPHTKVFSSLLDSTLRRYPRFLLPILVTTMFAFAILSLGWMHNVEHARLQQADPVHAKLGTVWLAQFYLFEPDFLNAFVQSVYSAMFNYQSEGTYNGNLWTMEKEMYGSFMIFALLGLSMFRKSHLYVYALTLGVLLYIGVEESFWAIDFIVGCILSYFYVHRGPLVGWCQSKKAIVWLTSNKWVGIAVAIFCIYMAGDFNGQPRNICIATFCCLISLSLTPVRRFLSSPPLLFLGRISFGLYLIHMPIICSLGCGLYLWVLPHGGHWVAAVASAIAVIVTSIFGGWVVYHLADQPSVALARRVSRFLLGAPKAATIPAVS